jgi:hypothetical protein
MCVRAADGVPWRQVHILLAVTLADSFSAAFLFPIVPYMVADFGIPLADVGFSAGVRCQSNSEPVSIAAAAAHCLCCRNC